MEPLLKESDRLQKTYSIFCLAETLMEKSLYLQALRNFEKALKGYISLRDGNGIFSALLALGDTYRMTGNFDRAADRYTEAIDLARQLKSPVLVTDAMVGLGLSLRAQGDWKGALRNIETAYKIYVKKDDREGIAFTLWAKAGTLRIKGSIPEAILTFREARKAFQSLKDKNGYGYCLCGLGGASRIEGRFKDSLKYYMAANRLFSGMKDTFGTAYSYCGMGNAYRMLGDYKTAFAYFGKATKLYEKIGDIVSYSYTIWGLATGHKMLGDYGKAARYMDKAMANFRKTKDPRGIIYCKLGFGEIAMMTGKKALAKRHLESALNESAAYGFAVEKCYAETLMQMLGGKADNSCYKRLGLSLRFQALPLNIP
jgi:tetratricopeptide (TPR) repeat protein